MFVKSVRLKNIRGFEDLDFDFRRGDGSYAGWTVFTGDNGSGKSTLLKAIATGLTGADTARALQPSFHRWIRDGASEGRIHLEIVRCESDDQMTRGGHPPLEDFPAEIALKNGGRQTTLAPALPEGKPGGYSTPQRTIWSLNSKGWFSCGYGPFRRMFGASAEATKQMVAPTTERYVTMFQEAASLSEVDSWLRNLKHKELENKTAETEQLKLLLSILRDELLPNQITLDRVDSDGLWLRDRNGVSLTWGEMSDGYRSALTLLADIVRHLINAYGTEGLSADEDGQTRIRRSGVVLIDEVDAHLHPEWQRQIGFWLTNHFPHIQFLVTTHSPIICQAADSNGIFVLPDPGSGELARALTEDEYKRIIASRPDTILRSPAFGLQNTRSPAAVEGRAVMARLNSKKRAGARLSPTELQTVKQIRQFVDFAEETPD